MRTQTISMLAVAALATITLTVTAAPALGGEERVRVKSEITVALVGAASGAFGRVNAKKAACRKHRSVRTFIQREGGPKKLWKATNTENDNEWLVGADIQGEFTFWAVAMRKERPRYVCLRDKSPVMREPGRSALLVAPGRA